jgi:hypothetical protein
MIVEFITLMAAVAAPAHEATAKPPLGLVEAVVVTDQTPAAKDLAKPAVFIKDGGKSAIIGQPGPGPIA